MAFNFDTLTLNLFHKHRHKSSLPSCLAPGRFPFTLHSFVSVRDTLETICIQALATVIQSTHAQCCGEGTAGHQAASVFTMPPLLFLPPSFTPETELNSLELNEIMIQHHSSTQRTGTKGSRPTHLLGVWGAGVRREASRKRLMGGGDLKDLEALISRQVKGWQARTGIEGKTKVEL